MKVWIEKKLVRGRNDRLQGEPILGKALWSPPQNSKGADIYRPMREVSPDDVVLHFTDNDGITGISRAATPYTTTDGTEHSDWTGPAYKIALKDFQLLAPIISKAELLQEENKAMLDHIRENERVFYNHKLNLNQGAYLTESPVALTKLINSIYKKKTGQDLPYLTNFIQVSNALASGAGSGKWEELKVVVKKIGDRDAVEKFFQAAGHILTTLNLTSEDQLVYAAALATQKKIQLTIGSRYVTTVQKQGKSVTLGYYVPAQEVERLQVKYPTLMLGTMDGGRKRDAVAVGGTGGTSGPRT